MIAANFFFLLESYDITKEIILDIAYKTGLIVRKRALMPDDLLYALTHGMINDDFSYNDLAMKIDQDFNKSVSKQAISKKLKEPCKLFIQELVELLLKRKIEKDKYTKIFESLNYKRIIVQDSTIVKLPASLFEIFSGVSNKKAKSTNARIQVVYDLIAEEFISFDIHPYSKNDTKVTSDLQIEEGDLVLRDRGYLTLNEIARHKKNKADCIFRHKFKTMYLDVNTLEPIDLTGMLKQNGILDIEVRLNNEEKTKVRLMSSPVEKSVADERRRKAKKESKHKNPSKEYLEQQDWTIFISTIVNTDIDFNDIQKLYSLRWRIEIIFKGWKSNLNFSKLHNISEVQCYVMLFARFFMAILFTNFFYKHCKIIVYEKYKKHLSLIKIQKYLVKYPQLMADLFEEIIKKKNKEKKGSILKLCKYCCYDKRTDRMNFNQSFNQVVTLS